MSDLEQNIQISSEDNLAMRVPKGFQIAGFILSLWSILFFLIPYLNVVPATLGFIFSLKSIKRKALHGLSVAGVVLSSLALVGSLITSVSFTVFIAKPNDRQPCKVYLAEIEQLALLIRYMEIDLTAQNMTGYYDTDSLSRELLVIETEAKKLDSIEGSKAFNSSRDETIAALKGFISFSKSKITGSYSSLTNDSVQQRIDSAFNNFADYCDAQ